MREYPTIDVIIPALNEEANLSPCLEAIFRQQYPRDKLRVSVIDGGSTDATVKIAADFGCRILHNEEGLAEPGVYQGIEESDCDLCCVLAVDNIIANEDDFFRKLRLPFQERGAAGAFPLVAFNKSEPAINKYINYRAEPFSEFIYGRACNARTFAKIYSSRYENDDYAIYNYRADSFPLLALAQGFTLDREKFQRDTLTRYDDILPIINIIQSGGEIAFLKTARIYHYQIMSLGSFIKKFQWRIRNNLLRDRPSGTKLRKNFKLRQFAWLIYSATILLPLLYSLYRIIQTRKLFYGYHFITNTILLFLIPYTFVKFKMGQASVNYKRA